MLPSLRKFDPGRGVIENAVTKIRRFSPFKITGDRTSGDSHIVESHSCRQRRQASDALVAMLRAIDAAANLNGRAAWRRPGAKGYMASSSETH